MSILYRGGLRFAPYPALLAVVVVAGGVRGNAQPAQLPTLEQFDAALATCATGLNVTITTDLIGSVSNIYKGERSNGAATFKTETKFLELFPESERSKVYALYTQCIVRILHLQGEDSGTVRKVEADLELIKDLLERRNPAELDRYFKSKELEKKYPLGFALFYSDGRKTLYYGIHSGVSFDLSSLRASGISSDKFVMSGFKFTGSGGGTLAMNDVHVLTGAGSIVHLLVSGNVAVDIESLAGSTEGVAWVIGMKPR